MPEITGSPPGEEQPAQDRPEGLRREISAGGGRDHLGRGIGLLRSDPALLDGKAGDVSDSKDVCQPGHLTMRVDRYEALEGLRYPFDAYSTQSGQRDGAIRRDASVGDEA
jgi:hypothetical protein